MKLLGKTVNYFGIQLVVSQDTKYLVTTAKGEVIASEQIPDLDFDSDIGWLYDWGAYTVCVASVDLEGMDWKETLMEVK